MKKYEIELLLSMLLFVIGIILAVGASGESLLGEVIGIAICSGSIKLMNKSNDDFEKMLSDIREAR